MPDRIENGIAFLNGLKVGDIYGSNYIEITNAGILKFYGTAKIDDQSSTADVFKSISVGGTTNKATISSVGSLAFAGANVRSIDFSGVTISTNTDGCLISTQSTWLETATADACMVKLLCGSTATSGDYATLRIRARSNGVNTTGGVVGGNFSASANLNNYANLYAVQGYAQPLTYTQNNASNILCGVYSCVQRTAATSGRSWSLWTDTHETVKASAGHYLHRLSHNGGAINLDGIWTIYAGQGCDYLMNFENTNAPVTSGDKTGGTKTYSLAIYINGAVRYIQCYDAA